MDDTLLSRVNRSSRRMALTFHGLAGLLVLVALGVVAWGWLGPDSLAHYVETAYQPGGRIASGYQLAGLVALAVVNLGLWIAGLRSLGRMFHCFTHTEPLNHEAARWMRRAGQWFLAASLFAVFMQVPGSLIASLPNPAGERFVAIGLDSDHLIGLLTSLALIAVAHIQELAALIHAEHRQIV